MARSWLPASWRPSAASPWLRQGFKTDNGNEILDVHNLRITDPGGARGPDRAAGRVVEVGLFARTRVRTSSSSQAKAAWKP
jgi:ribose 5-phosphate isomerase A